MSTSASTKRPRRRLSDPVKIRKATPVPSFATSTKRQAGLLAQGSTLERRREMQSRAANEERKKEATVEDTF